MARGKKGQPFATISPHRDAEKGPGSHVNVAPAPARETSGGVLSPFPARRERTFERSRKDLWPARRRIRPAPDRRWPARAFGNEWKQRPRENPAWRRSEMSPGPPFRRPRARGGGYPRETRRSPARALPQRERRKILAESRGLWTRLGIRLWRSQAPSLFTAPREKDG